jgi:putative tricarboxylic transport membrane protein
MRLDRVLGIGAILLSVPVGLAAWRWGIGAVKAPGPGFWPFMIALAVGGLGAALALRPGSPAPVAASASRWRHLAIALATLAVYVATLERLGYLPTTGVLLLAQMRWVEERSWRASLLTAVSGAAVSYILFREILGVPLPAGIVTLPRW